MLYFVQFADFPFYKNEYVRRRGPLVDRMTIGVTAPVTFLPLKCNVTSRKSENVKYVCLRLHVGNVKQKSISDLTREKGPEVNVSELHFLCSFRRYPIQPYFFCICPYAHIWPGVDKSEKLSKTERMSKMELLSKMERLFELPKVSKVPRLDLAHLLYTH